MSPSDLSTDGTIQFNAATFMKETLAHFDTAQDAPTWLLRTNAWNQGLEIAGFLRWSSARSGMFVSVGNLGSTTTLHLFLYRFEGWV